DFMAFDKVYVMQVIIGRIPLCRLVPLFPIVMLGSTFTSLKQRQLVSVAKPVQHVLVSTIWFKDLRGGEGPRPPARHCKRLRSIPRCRDHQGFLARLIWPVTQRPASSGTTSYRLRVNVPGFMERSTQCQTPCASVSFRNSTPRATDIPETKPITHC